MPEVTITIGGRDFDVACQEGEEHFLRAAAGMLDAEATTLLNQIGRMPEGRMLLMAGLLLADKAAGTEDKMRALEARVGALTAELEESREAAMTRDTVEVPVIPTEVSDGLAELAARAEALADAVEERAGGQAA
ncbi:MAG: cell division protein ZapA [Pseudomonadota bacterium]